METARGFELRTVALPCGAAQTYDEAAWRDALVVVACGELELECVGGASVRFGRGAVLCLVGLPVRELRSSGTEPAVLVTVSRR